jgi:TolA-binding protein
MSEIKETIDEQLGGSLSKAEQFYQKNKNAVLIGAGVVVLGVAGFFGMRYMNQTKQVEANARIFMIENYFEMDSFDLVLNGNPKAEEPIGAIDFVSEYGSTPAGQRAAYMAGIAYMNKKDYQTAIEYFAKFNLGEGLVKARALGCTGDCYSELGNYDEAESYYKKAANASENEFTTPEYLKKLGLVQEQLGNYKEAAKSYTRIKDKYAESEVGRDIEKYIAKANAKAGVTGFED